MNKNLTALILGIGLLSLSSCSGNKKETTATQEQQPVSTSSNSRTSPIDLEGSTLLWKGFKPAGEHYGSIALSDGQIELHEDKLVSGFVEVDMRSIKVTDLEGEMAEKLKAHLEGEDFFDVTQHPKARFELTDLPEEGLPLLGLTEIKGNLTLKGIVKNISIPIEDVLMDQSTQKYQIRSKKFLIDRSEWNVRYGSKKFFDNLADKFINDEIELQFVLSTR